MPLGIEARIGTSWIGRELYTFAALAGAGQTKGEVARLYSQPIGSIRAFAYGLADMVAASRVLATGYPSSDQNPVSASHYMHGEH